MSQFTLTIETNNAAFDDEPGPEIARIMRRAADYIELRGPPLHGMPLHDSNGNTCGSAALFGKG